MEKSSVDQRKGVSHKKFTNNFNEIVGDALKEIHRLIHQEKVTVFVHCRSGKHRSVAVVTGYIMMTHDGMSWDEAFAYVKKQRKCAHEFYRQATENIIKIIKAK